MTQKLHKFTTIYPNDQNGLPGDERAPSHNQQHPSPLRETNRLSEHKKSSHQPEGIAHAAQRIGHPKRKILQDVEPEHRSHGEGDSASEKPPVGKLRAEELPAPGKLPHTRESKFEHHLTATKKHCLHHGKRQKFKHRIHAVPNFLQR